MKFEYIVCVLVIFIFVYAVMNKELVQSYFTGKPIDNSSSYNDSGCVSSSKMKEKRDTLIKEINGTGQ